MRHKHLLCASDTCCRRHQLWYCFCKILEQILSEYLCKAREGCQYTVPCPLPLGIFLCIIHPLSYSTCQITPITCPPITHDLCPIAYHLYCLHAVRATSCDEGIAMYIDIGHACNLHYVDRSSHSYIWRTSRLCACSVLAVQTGPTIHICQRGLLQRRCCGDLAAVQLSAHKVAIESMHGSNTLQVASGLQIRGQQVWCQLQDLMSCHSLYSKGSSESGLACLRPP